MSAIIALDVVDLEIIEYGLTKIRPTKLGEARIKWLANRLRSAQQQLTSGRIPA